MNTSNIKIFSLLLLVSCSSSDKENPSAENKLIASHKDSVKMEKEEKKEEKPDHTRIDSLTTGLKFFSNLDYKKEKNEIASLRSKLLSQLHDISDSNQQIKFLDSVSLEFTSHLLNRIVPHWYGTPWDYEGHTAVPNDGEIACGYFVSTTLRDMGLKVNRYDLAKKAGAHEAQSIAVDQKNLTIYQNQEYSNTPEFLNILDEGLFFVGLDNHVGYLYKKEKNTYFIHSNYVDGYVMIENTQASSAFLSSVYYVTKITHNAPLMKIWLEQKELFVYR